MRCIQTRSREVIIELCNWGVLYSEFQGSHYRVVEQSGTEPLLKCHSTFDVVL